MDDWSDLFVATAGASATLAGLLFVGLSINLDKLVNLPGVLLRAAASLALLTSMLGLSILLLIPDQSVRNAGIEVLGVAIASACIVGILSLRSIRDTPPQYRGNAMALSGLRVFALAPLAASGALMIANHPNGTDLLVPGMLMTFIVTIVDAWVILVEIAR
jgi:modulator of FtsH protease